MPHPRLELYVYVDHGDNSRFGRECSDVQGQDISVLVDSGAQCCLWGLADCQKFGFKMGDLIPSKQGLSAVSKIGLHISGAVFLRLKGISKGGKSVDCAVFVYISPDINGFFLSREAMIQLGVIGRDFPTVSGTPPVSISASSCDHIELAECGCPKRALPPGRPDELPFPCTEDNIPHMEKWLLDRYASSTLNTCPHQVLPNMSGPPVEIHIDPKAKPMCASVPSQVPLHWEAQVKSDLERDELLGVIEKVPYGEPCLWCHRMVLSRKADGNPRRTVDLSPLNKYCVREVHTNKSPFDQVRGVPSNVWRTVADAWKDSTVYP